MTFHQDVGFQAPPPQDPVANASNMVNLLSGMRSYQGQTDLGEAYKAAVDPDTGQINPLLLNKSLAASKSPWQVGPGGIQAGQAQSAEATGQQEQWRARQQQLTTVAGLLSKYDLSQPHYAPEIQGDLDLALKGGLITPLAYQQSQAMLGTLHPGESANNLIQSMRAVTQNAQDIVNRNMPPTVDQTMQAQQWLGAFADPWTDQYGNVWHGTNADKLRFYGQDPNMFLRGGVNFGQGGGGGPAHVENPAARNEIAAIPEVQKLPAAVQGKVVDAMVNAGLGPQAAAQYARMIWQESHGNQVDPQTGKIVTSNRGAQGIAQVEPDTFTGMQKKYGIQGDITNIDANLNAGARYFKEGLDQGNGDLRAAAAYYVGGPKGLDAYLHGQANQDVLNYIRDTHAPGSGGGGGFPPGQYTRTPMTLGTTQDDSAKMFIAARQNYATTMNRVSNLTQALGTLRSHESLETGPLADDIASLKTIGQQLGLNFGDIREGDTTALAEINKVLNRYYQSQPGSQRSDMGELETKLANPSAKMQRQALDDLIARTIGMEYANNAGYLDFVSRHPGRTSLAAGDYADEAPGYINSIDPMGFAFRWQSREERTAYRNSLPSKEDKDLYEHSIEEASRLYHWRIPGS